ncbi:MAG: hypothetical protein QM496_01830 [Verrucomicrobiota bacterium]
MQRWHDHQIEALRTNGSMTLEVDMDTFNAWNQAALEDGKIISDWAIDQLTAAAAADPEIQRLAAEDPSIYKTKGEPRSA